MNVSRRRLIAGAIATVPVALAGPRAFAQAPTTLKISHQFPGGTIDSGDFRDRLVRKFAQEVEKRHAWFDAGTMIEPVHAQRHVDHLAERRGLAAFIGCHFSTD